MRCFFSKFSANPSMTLASDTFTGMSTNPTNLFVIIDSLIFSLTSLQLVCVIRMH